MQKYKITAPDGRVFIVKAPNGATREEVMAYAQANAPKVAYGPIRGAAENLFDGALLNFGNEASAAMDAARAKLGGGEFGPAYRQALASRDAHLAGWQNEHPNAAMATTLAGASVPAILTAGQSAPASVGAATVRSAGQGAALGGVAGAGGAEDGDRLTGAYRGAMLGGGFGAAAPAIAHVGGRVYGMARDAFGGRDPSRTVAKVVGGAIDDAGMTADDIRAQARAPDFGNKPEMLMDITGEAGRRAARGVQAIPGKASENMTRKLAERQEDVYERLSNDLTSRLGARENTGDALESLLALRRSRAQGNYDEAYGAGVIDDPRITDLYSRPVFQDAVQGAERLASARGRPFAWNRDGATVENLDFIKKHLDDVVTREFRGGSPEYAKAVREIRDTVRETLKERVPAYAKALQQYSDDASAKEALEAGFQRFLSPSTSPKDVARMMSKLDPEEKALFRQGALDRLMGAAGQDGGRSVIRRLMDSPNLRERVKLLFDKPEDFAAFSRDIARERNMARTSQTVLGGSPTARIAEDISAVDSGIIGAAKNPGGWKAGAVDWFARKVSRRSPKELEQISSALTAQTPEEIEAVLRTISDEKTRRRLEAQIRNLRAMRASGTAITPVAGLLGD